MPSAPTRSSTPLSVRSDLAELTGQLVAIDSTNPDLVPGGAGEAEIAAFVAGWLRRGGPRGRAVRSRAGTAERRRGRAGDGRRSLAPAQRAHGHGRRRGDGEPVHPGAEGRPPARARRRRHEGVARRDHARRRRGGAGRPARRRHRHRRRRRGGRQRRHGGPRPPDDGECGDRGGAHRGSGRDRAQGVRRVRGRDGRATPRTGPGRTSESTRSPPWGRCSRASPRSTSGSAPGTRHALLGTGSVHASVIEGGQEYSSYPAACRLQGERRTVPGETVAGVRAELEEIAAGTGATVSLPFHRSPFESSADAAVVRALHRHLGHEEVGGVAFWADSALLAGRGHPDRRLRAGRRRDPRSRRVGRPRLPRALPRRLPRGRPGAVRVSALRAVHVGVGLWGRSWAELVARAPGLPPRRGSPSPPPPAAPGRSRSSACRRSGISAARSRATGADVVVLASPPSTHRPLSELALAEGCHVISEKPLAPTLADARAIAAAADAAGRHAMAAQNYRFRRQSRALRDLVQSRALGRLLGIRISCRRDLRQAWISRRDWRGRMPHPYLLDMAIHHVDMLRMITGSEIVEVDARELAARRTRPSSTTRPSARFSRSRTVRRSRTTAPGRSRSSRRRGTATGSSSAPAGARRGPGASTTPCGASSGSPGTASRARASPSRCCRRSTGRACSRSCVARSPRASRRRRLLPTTSRSLALDLRDRPLDRGAPARPPRGDPRRVKVGLFLALYLRSAARGGAGRRGRRRAARRSRSSRRRRARTAVPQRCSATDPRRAPARPRPSRSAGSRSRRSRATATRSTPMPQIAATATATSATRCGSPPSSGSRPSSRSPAAPASPSGRLRPSWVTCSWPTEFPETLDWQWDERVLPYWDGAAAFARARGDPGRDRAAPGVRRLQHRASMLRLRAGRRRRPWASTSILRISSGRGWTRSPACAALCGCDLPRAREGHGVRGARTSRSTASSSRSRATGRRTAAGASARSARGTRSRSGAISRSPCRTPATTGALSIEHEDPLALPRGRARRCRRTLREALGA